MSETLSSNDTPRAQDRPGGGTKARLALAWAVVGIPLAYGIFETAKKASALFTG